MQLQEIITKVIMSAQEDWVKPLGHDTVFHRYDVNLTIGSSHEGEDIQQENFREPWANKFPDERATGYYYNVRYGTTVVARVILVSVDGGRALLPAPGIGKKLVPKLEWAVAEIFDTIGTLNEYASRAGFAREV